MRAILFWTSWTPSRSSFESGKSLLEPSTNPGGPPGALIVSDRVASLERLL